MAKRPWAWNEKAMMRFVAAARAGDLHTILDASPDEDLQTVLQRDDSRKYKHGWERLLALYLAQDHFKHEMDGIIYGYAELRYFSYDAAGDAGRTRQDRASARRADTCSTRATAGIALNHTITASTAAT
jgi:hypothetical protein